MQSIFSSTLLSFIFIFIVVTNQSQNICEYCQPANYTSDFVNYEETHVFDLNDGDPQFFYNQSGYIYSGYVNISNTRALKYYFMMKIGASIDPVTYKPIDNTDDIILYLDGGPGCSGLGDAATSLIGPMIFNGMTQNYSQVRFTFNNYSWNQFSNLIVFESPAGVGFSYLNDTDPYDEMDVANENLLALQLFIEGFGFQQNKVWIFGYSYGGIYVPYLSYAIHQFNQNASLFTNSFQFNFQGWGVGNAFTQSLAQVNSPQYTGTYGNYMLDEIQTYQNFGLVNDSLANSYWTACQQNTSECQQYSDLITNYTRHHYNGSSEFLDTYDLKGVCLQNVLDNQYSLVNQIPCSDISSQFNFFNYNETTRQLLHINQNITDFVWFECNLNLMPQYTPSLRGSYWIYEELVPLNKYKILVWSGSRDLIVNTVNTINWLNQLRSELQLDTIQYKKNWFYNRIEDPKFTELAGGYEEYTNGILFVNFYAAGHEVLGEEKAAGQTMARYFIQGLDLPDYEYINA